MSNGNMWDSTKESLPKVKNAIESNTYCIYFNTLRLNLMKDKTDDFAESLAKFFDYQDAGTQIF